MESEEVDCQDKMCFLEHHFEKLCSIAIHNGTNGCNIPCHMESCIFELHRNINCPQWTCVPLPTSTSTSTSTTSTTSPQSTTEVPHTEIVMVSSLAMNAILVVGIIALIVYLKAKAIQRRRQYQNPDEEMLESDNLRPIIRPHSQVPESFSMQNLEQSLQDLDQIINLEESGSGMIEVNLQTPPQNLENESNPFIKFQKFEEKKKKDFH